MAGTRNPSARGKRQIKALEHNNNQDNSNQIEDRKLKRRHLSQIDQ